jgi:hypothetical protein
LLALTGLSDHQQQIVNAVIELAHEGTAPAGEWIALASASGNHWKEIESGVLKAQASPRR